MCLNSKVSELETLLGQGHVRLGRLEGELRERQTQLEETEGDRDRGRQRIAELEGIVAALQNDLQRVESERSAVGAQLDETQNRLSSALEWNTQNELRAQRALEKLQSDSEAIEKTKRAMAIALTLLADLPPHHDPGPPRQA